MGSFGHKNWIKYGHGPTYESSWSSITALIADFSNNNLALTKLNLIDAAKYTVDTIINNYPPPYTLLCSGGVDSQTMIWFWVCSGAPFEIVTCRYNSNEIIFNQEDICDLSAYCHTFGKEVRFIDLDIVDFLENQLKDIARLTNGDSPHICTHMKISSLIPQGTAIFSGNFLHPGGSFLSFTHLSLQRYAEKFDTRSKKTIPFFLIHTPELAYSFFDCQPMITNSDYETKVLTLRNHGVLVPGQSKKMTGFEKIKEYYDSFPNRISIKDRLQHCAYPSKRVFDLLFRYPLKPPGLPRKINKIDKFLILE